MNNKNRTLRSGPVAGDFQDIRIREVPSELVRRLKSVIALRGQTLCEWFMIEAAKTANNGYDKPWATLHYIPKDKKKNSPRIEAAVSEMKRKGAKK